MKKEYIHIWTILQEKILKETYPRIEQKFFNYHICTHGKLFLLERYFCPFFLWIFHEAYLAEMSEITLTFQHCVKCTLCNRIMRTHSASQKLAWLMSSLYHFCIQWQWCYTTEACMPPRHSKVRAALISVSNLFQN